MIGQIWALLKGSVDSFLEDEALTRGAPSRSIPSHLLGQCYSSSWLLPASFSARRPRAAPCPLNLAV